VTVEATITTRDGLIAAIPSHMVNNSLLTPTICADFIRMTETEANRAIRGRVSAGRSVAILSEEGGTVPEDFLGEISFRLDVSSRGKLAFKSVVEFDDLVDRYPATGQPQVFTIVGGEFRFLPAPDTDYTATLTYWRKVPPLTDASQSNWLLDAHPDVYLYGCLMHAAAFLKDWDEKAQYEAWFGAALQDVAKTEIEAAMGGTLQMSPSGNVA
jgi:hypothetical protein